MMAPLPLVWRGGAAAQQAGEFAALAHGVQQPSAAATTEPTACGKVRVPWQAAAPDDREAGLVRRRLAQTRVRLDVKGGLSLAGQHNILRVAIAFGGAAELAEQEHSHSSLGTLHLPRCVQSF